MKLYEQIRRSYEREQLSVCELARRFRVHRRDVRQALASAVPPERKKAERPATALDRWKPTIDGWLEADRTAPRKQRHTARRVWQRLVEEHGAAVGESTVRRYVAEVRRGMDVPPVEVMVPAHHPLGEEAEVDFGTASVYLAGVLVDVSMFIMRLSASGRGYPRAYLNEAQEVFLDGHVRAFEHFGGVPKQIRYDNLKAAVERVLKGRDRIESDRFIALGRTTASTASSVSPASKAIEARRAHEPAVATVVPIGEGLSRFDRPAPSIACYDDLLEAQ